MFNIGNLVIYSGQGICRIDDICAKTYWDVTKDYYVLYPIENCKLTISIPIENDKVTMLELIDRNEAVYEKVTILIAVSEEYSGVSKNFVGGVDNK